MSQHYIWQLLFLVYVGAVWFAITRPSVKVLEQTSNKLLFRLRPTLAWGVEIFFGGIGLLFLVFCVLYFTPITTLTCDRSTTEFSITTLQNTSDSAICELVGVNWLGLEKSKTLISGLQRAIEETKADKDENGKISYRYGVLLQTIEGNVPFTEFYFGSEYDYEERQALISQINAFIENPSQTSLKVQQDDRLTGFIGFCISRFFFFISLLIMALCPVITCTFDKEVDHMIIKRWRWFGEKIFEHSINEISDVKVEDSSTDEGSVYRVTLTLSSGENVSLTRSYTSGFEEKQYIAKLIKSFLNLGRFKPKEQTATG